jgi:glycosyltransferase involved in cell wall biosynthesis
VITVLPSISIVVPAKNEETHIGRCLNSLVSQDYPRELYEIIVVDNGSTDRTCELVDKFRQNHKIVLLHFNGKTISSVRNHGAGITRGNILAFLDADCEAPPQWLQCGLELVLSDENIGCVGFVAAEPDETGTWVEKAWSRINSRGRFVGTVQKEWLSSFNMILRKGTFQEVGGFNESLTTCEDADLGYRIGVNRKLLISDKVKIRHLGESKTVEDFFQRELWRGTSNLSSFFSSANKKRDFFSTFVPPAYVLFHLVLILVILITFLVGTERKLLVVATIISIGFLPAVIVLKKSKNLTGIFEFFEVLSLCYLYLIARGLAMFIGSPRKAKMKED